MNLSKVYIFIFLFILAKTPANARVFSILGTPEIAYRMQDQTNVKGIDIDIIATVMSEMNVDYHIDLIKSGSRIINEAKLGKTDMVLSFSKKKARLAYLLYPKESYKDLMWNFFIRKGDKDKIKYNTLADLKGLVVGATQDWSYTPEFWNAGLELSILTNNSLQMKKLLKKHIDVVPLNTVVALFEAKQKGYFNDIAYLPKPLKTKPYYNAFVRKSTYPNIDSLIQQYDKIIKRMKADGSLQKIYKKYLGEKNL